MTIHTLEESVLSRNLGSPTTSLSGDWYVTTGQEIHGKFVRDISILIHGDQINKEIKIETEQGKFIRTVKSAAGCFAIALKDSVYVLPIKANGANCDSQFWREQAPTKTCESRGSSGGVGF